VGVARQDLHLEAVTSPSVVTCVRWHMPGFVGYSLKLQTTGSTFATGGRCSYVVAKGAAYVRRSVMVTGT
jgi:hypothetical protein